ncbi:MAG: PIN domain nuclease [Candidatus Omnitrophota bacterium]
MKKLKLYLDTSVLNFALTDKLELSLQKKATVDLLDEIKQGKYEGYVSEQVLIEIARAPQEKTKRLNQLVSDLDIESLSFSEEIEGVANKYIAEGIIPVKYKEDALHLAIASVNNLDVVVSWNFEHIVKLKTKQGVAVVNTMLGYKPIEIVSPQEVI